MEGEGEGEDIEQGEGAGRCRAAVAPAAVISASLCRTRHHHRLRRPSRRPKQLGVQEGLQTEGGLAPALARRRPYGGDAASQEGLQLT